MTSSPSRLSLCSLRLLCVLCVRSLNSTQLGFTNLFWLRRIALLFLFCLFFSLASSPASATIHYTISLAQPEQHWLRVTMTIPNVPSSVTVSLPAWNALYQVRDFSFRVAEFRAHEGQGSRVAFTRTDKQSWRIQRLARSARADITITYRIYWDDPGAFSAQLNDKHAFLNLALVLFYIPDRRAEDTRVSFTDLRPDWRIFIPLSAAANSSTTFTARNYDALVDAPVEIGPFEDFRFTANNARIRVIVHGQSPGQQTLTDTLSKIVACETTLMRDVPFNEYLFIYHFGEGGGGGMEHANSTAIHVGASAEFMGVSAHEFFHLWNVKRIRPKSLEPVNYTGEQYTRALWFAEGVTSTYGSYALLRSGLWTREQFLADLAGEITTLESRPSRLWQSVEESSFNAWFEKYNLYRRPEFSISYYNKGQILGHLLDILLRDASDNRASLDDVLRYLNENYAKKGRFYDDSSGILAASSAVLASASQRNPTRSSSDNLSFRGVPVPRRGDTGTTRNLLFSMPPYFATPVAAFKPAAHFFQSPHQPCPLCGDSAALNEESAAELAPQWLRDFFAKYVAGTDPLPYDDIFARAGLRLEPRPSGGFSLTELPNPTPKQRRILDGFLKGATN